MAVTTASRDAIGALRGGSNAQTEDWLLPGRPSLTLEAADRMADAAIAESKGRGFNDISVVILDASGRAIVHKTMLGCPPLPAQLAFAKATACVGTHAASSRSLKDKYVTPAEPTKDRTAQLLQMSVVGVNLKLPIAAFPGGLLCRDQEGNVVGSIGVSGAAADEDEHCAIVGAQAVGLATDPGTSRLA